jgi:hypothetical protein
MARASKGKAKVEGFNHLMDILDNRLKQSRGSPKPKLEIGYTADYAIYVHENLQARHPIGQAKFLEQPMREHKKEIMRIVRQALANRTPLKSAIALGGLYLLGQSKQLVPVDTGHLRQSGYMRVV